MNDKTSTRPNIREVASLAGVSHQTVSRVINGHPSIRPATRERVMRVIEEVGYRPSSAARALALRRNSRLGVVVDSAVKFGPNSTLRAVEEAAREAGYTVSVVSVADEGRLTVRGAIDNLLDQGIEALAVIAPRASALDDITAHGYELPTTIVSSIVDPRFMTASMNQEEAARLAVDHLFELGHRRIGHVAGPLDWIDAQGRVRGWSDALAAHGLEAPPLFVGDWEADSGYDFGMRFDPAAHGTALFMGNDQMALGFLHACVRRGIDVPAEVSVVGVDDLPEARHFWPPLTTIRQDFHALGVGTVAGLLAALRGEKGDHSIVIPGELVVRESTREPQSL